MNNEKLYSFVEEIINKAKNNGLSSKEVNEKLDTVIDLFKVENQTENAAIVCMLKKYIYKILSSELNLLQVFKIISSELLDLSKPMSNEKNNISNSTSVIEFYNSSYGQVEVDHCGIPISNVPVDHCGMPVYTKTVDHCGVSTSSCGSTRGSSRC